MPRFIPYGRWHPDAEQPNAPILLEAANVLPTANGYRPIGAVSAVSQAVGGIELVQDRAGDDVADRSGNFVVTNDGATGERVRGAINIYATDGTIYHFAGTETGLWTLDTGSLAWDDVTRTSGGAYATAEDDRWRFAEFGSTLIATNFTDAVQAYTLGSSTDFAALAGSPPKARYIAVLRDFVVLANTVNSQREIHWSDANDATDWTPGSPSLSDTQDIPDGGPITGVVGGEVAYVFQRENITRMTFVPGSGAIMQFDLVEQGRGCYAPDSLVSNGYEAFYLAMDGPYRMNLLSGTSQPIGIAKFRDWLVNDIAPGTHAYIDAALDVSNNRYMMAYISNNGTSDTIADRILIYDWMIDEASIINADVAIMQRWLSPGYTLEQLDQFGSIDGLPYSLDHSFWKGGAPLLAVFSSDNKMSYFAGDNMQATMVTGDGQLDGKRVLVRGTRPHIDTTEATVALAGRERDGDAVSYGPTESMEDTGEVPGWASGNYVRAKVVVPSGATWTSAKGLDTDAVDAGER